MKKQITIRSKSNNRKVMSFYLPEHSITLPGQKTESLANLVGRFILDGNEDRFSISITTVEKVIFIDGRGDYLTGMKFQANGKPEIFGGSKKDAIRYTDAEARELLKTLGRGYGIEDAE